MKTRFNTYDIICMVTDLQRLVGMRVNQVYDIDNRSYLIRLQRSEEKCVLLLESGNRFHTTQFEWPKNQAPSGFTMKLRKHLKNKRLESLTQLGIDRIVDLQFGSGEAAYHVILELYDRGNIVLTDHEWTTLNVLRPHVEGDKIRFAVKEKYPLDRAKSDFQALSDEKIREIFSNRKSNDNLKKILNPNVEYGPAIIDHVLKENGLSGNMKMSPDPTKGFQIERDLSKLIAALKMADDLMVTAKKQIAKGYIIQKKELRPNPAEGESEFLLTNLEFHPMLFAQNKEQPYVEYDTFDRAVDEFFSALEGQKIDLKTIQVEREALKKLENVRKDQNKRVTELEQTQETDRHAAELIIRNANLVEHARTIVQYVLASQVSWDDIPMVLEQLQATNDPVTTAIKDLKLKTNQITLLLHDPETSEDADPTEKLEPMLVDIYLSVSAYGNARRYYDRKRTAAKKQQKTLESAGKALKNAERKTKQTLKEVQTISTINKARKTYWFEKFYWFISSDNYLVIGGRDQQQNELLVKRYLRPGDAYVHADVVGASSIVVKNFVGGEVPPRTLSEAGQAAVAYSVSWEAKVLTSAWWVHAHQVSKSAPTGEFLTTGSFMIRGKKNYLLPQHLQMGFSFLFRLEDSSVERHIGERKPIAVDDTMSNVTSVQDTEEEQEIIVSDDDESDKEDGSLQINNELHTITEEVSKSEKQPVADDTNTEINQRPSSPLFVFPTLPTLKRNQKVEDKDVTDSEDSSDEGLLDTHVMIDHDSGKVHTKSKPFDSAVSFSNNNIMPTKDSGLFAKSKKQEAKTQTKTKDGPKRGQKGKLKKIKEKYKDQDDEDRAAMMEMLQSAKGPKESKKAMKKSTSKSKGGAGKVKIPQPAPLILEADSEPEEPEPDLEGDQQASSAEVEILSQLTGCPFTEDELLFAVPVVAPYSALHNYKFKVKLTPGGSKRGKAAKTAVQVFTKDKTCSPREKDLLRAVKEENLARNFPGKVKLSAPQLHKHKK